ncbi:MAG TPA: tRNA (adenosine(37)-N6)-threonylcarbamoyltransferase complex dimerization subunit type 1 TsaB [Hyphomicrobiaceae bacterium]|nr:tRNA (adenosine(37)-N6)-threonylcarbamoyltransferase complex dimerization subunit type 1 TsaB [Hyphomicrobiaceae bacterium]
MITLAFETCYGACSAAIGEADNVSARVIASRLERMATGHAERLPLLIEAVASEAGITLRQLQRIAVTIGPGSFTGIRVGVAMARGLALATGAEVVATTSLALISTGAGLAGADHAVAMPGPKGLVAVELFGSTPTPPRLLEPVELAAALPAACRYICGAGSRTAAVELAKIGRCIEARDVVDEPSASTLLRLAGTLSPVSDALLPLYLKEADAKPQIDRALPRVPST